MDEAVGDAAPQAQAAQVRLKVPSVDDALMVEGDAFLLRQALGNLIDNALAFSPKGGQVRIGARRDGERIAIEVCDHGPGVPDYARDRVFERFYSLARPDGGSRSSGLGLSFVAEVAALHGGEATLRNIEGGGALATLSLPAA